MAGLIVSSIIGAGTSLAAAKIGANASKSAAATQQAASDKAVNVEQQQNSQTQAMLAPWLAAGGQGMQTLGGVLNPGRPYQPPVVGMPPQGPSSWWRPNEPHPGSGPGYPVTGWGPPPQPSPQPPPQVRTPMNWYPNRPPMGS